MGAGALRVEKRTAVVGSQYKTAATAMSDYFKFYNQPCFYGAAERKKLEQSFSF
jgi:hypothetical protein